MNFAPSLQEAAGNPHIENMVEPNGGEFSLDTALNKFDSLLNIAAESGIRVDEDATILTERFIRRAYEDFNGTPQERFEGHAFVVPSRVTRHDTSSIEEVRHFLPAIPFIAKELSEAGFSNKDTGLYIRRMLENIPPTVIERYQRGGGAVVFSPIFADIHEDYRGIKETMLAVRKIINQTTNYVSRLGSSVVGLGATLPKLTNYGKYIEDSGIITTTGHGGTAWLANKIAKNAMTVSQDGDNVGIVGLGAMGSVIAETLVRANTEDKMYYLYDENSELAHKSYSRLTEIIGGNKIVVANSIKDLLAKSGVIVSAVTKGIDLDADELCEVDLTGKIIVDDSQPGQFNRQQVEARNGQLWWVVGSTKSPSLIRTTDWNYGGTIVSKDHGFGCEYEAASISLLRQPGLRERVALRDAATYADIQNIGKVLECAGVTIAPPQSYGRPSLSIV